MKLLFLHVPKTGGTSLVNNVLFRAYPLDQRYTEDDLVLNPACQGHRNTFGELLQMSSQFGVRYRDLFDVYVRNRLVPTDRAMYSGHFCFGIHDALPADCRYLTVLRPPVERVVSNYNLLRSIGWFTRPFADFLRGGPYQATNLQVKMLSLDGMRVGAALGRDHLEECKWNLRRWFDFCVLEHLDPFARALMCRHGWDYPYTGAVHNRTAEMHMVKGNPTARHVAFDAEISTADRELAREVNALDAELYEWAWAMSAERWGDLRAAA